MTLPESAAAVIGDIRTATKDFPLGTIPGVPELTGLQSRVVELYFLLGEEESRMFSAKEKAILDRKCAAARHHLGGRRDRGLTVADAKEETIQRTKEEHEAEIAAESLYEHHKILRGSLDKAFVFLQQTIATVKAMESRSPSSS
jgi:hypothetical protein